MAMDIEMAREMQMEMGNEMVMKRGGNGDREIKKSQVLSKIQYRVCIPASIGDVDRIRRVNNEHHEHVVKKLGYTVQNCRNQGLLMEGSGSVLIITNLDPGSHKTSGFCGPGSGTLIVSEMSLFAAYCRSYC